MKRRTFLLGTLGATSAAVLAACTPGTPRVTPSPTPAPPPQLLPSVGAIPRPAGMVRTSWGSDHFARGAVSFNAVGSTDDDRDALAAPVGDRLFFAGEATSRDQPGTVGGARASGTRVATEVLQASASGDRILVVGAGIAGLTA